MAGRRMAELPYRLGIFYFFRNFLNFFLLCDKNIFPVKAAMINWKTSELAGSKWVKVRGIIPKGGSLCIITNVDVQMERTLVGRAKKGERTVLRPQRRKLILE